MPGMDGIAATKLIRAAGNTTPIIALTANASDSDRDLCRAAGMDRFESKPVTMRRLAQMLRETDPGTGFRPQAMEPAALPQTTTGLPDASRFNELADAIGEEELHALFETFLGEAPGMLRELHEAMLQKDHQQVDRTLHNLKGAAATLGFDRLAALSQGYRAGGVGDDAAARLSEEIDRIGRNIKRKAA